jgi:hypothetical protein
MPPEIDHVMGHYDFKKYKRRQAYYEKNPRIYVGRSPAKKIAQDKWAKNVVVSVLAQNPHYTYVDLKNHMIKMDSSRGPIIRYDTKISRNKVVKMYNLIYLPPEHICFDLPEPIVENNKVNWLDENKPLIAALLFLGESRLETYKFIWGLNTNVAQSSFYRWCKNNDL